MRLSFALLTAAALGVAGPVPAQTPAAAPREVRLPNGIVALLAPDPAAAAVDVAAWHPAGSGFETDATSGAAFLLERLALSGRWSPAAARALDRLRAEGGVHAGLTTADFSSHHVTVAPEALEAALRFEAAFLAPPALTAAGFAREQREGREALARTLDRGPVARALQSLHAEVFGGHPYSRPVAGDPARRDAMTGAALRGYAAARYGPPATRFTVVGRFDPDSAIAALRRTVGAVERRAAPAPRPALAAPSAGRRVEIASEGRFAMLAAAWRLPGAADSARALFPLLSAVLAEGPGSRLVEQLATVPDAPCHRLEGSIVEREGATLLYFVAALKENADTAAVGAAVREAARELAAAPVTDDELSRARALVEMRRLDALQTTRGRGIALGSAWMTSGSWRAAAADLERIRNASAAELQRAAARVLTEAALTEVWMLPAAEGAR